MINYAAFLLLLLVIVVVAVIGILAAIFAGKVQPKREYGVTSVTLKGETVRSIGEKRIADYFARNNIRYVYEHGAIRTFRLYRYKYRRNISIPDFYLPDYGLYVEYWGLVNADDYWTRERYVRNMKRKMAIYHENNIKFISIYPKNLENLDWIFRAKFRKVTGYELSK